jgi:radical SAM protein with 4Fe4S-binding SPASM domain
LAYHQEAVDEWFRALLVGRQILPSVYFRDLLLPLLDGLSAVPQAGGCEAAEANFAIGPDGDLYACQLFYGDPAYRVGNVLSSDYPGMCASLPIGPADYAVCANCFARHWCQPCAALNGACGDVWQPPERLCALRRAVVLQIGRWAFGHLAVPANKVTSILHEAVGKR